MKTNVEMIQSQIHSCAFRLCVCCFWLHVNVTAVSSDLFSMQLLRCLYNHENNMEN